MSVRVQHRRDSNANVEANTPAVGELWMDTTKKELTLGDGALQGGVRLAKKNLGDILIPAQITADTNDYNPTGMKHARTVIISTDASRDITGLVPTTVGDTVDGREITIYNGGSNIARLVDQSTSSTAANRFDFGGQDMQLAPKRSVTLRYRTQGGLNRWELDAQTIGAGVGSGAVIAMTLAASSQGMSMINGILSAAVASGALTIAIKTLAGNNPSALDPVHIVVRDATLANGGFSVLTLTAATSLVISSGSSLGMSNAVPFKIWIVGFNDAGTFRLAATGHLPGEPIRALLAAETLASATAEGGAGGADSRSTFYAGVGIASKPFAILGYFDYPAGLAAAGTWNIAPTTIQLFRAGVPVTSGTPDGKKFQRDDGVLARVLTARTQLDTVDLDTVLEDGSYTVMNTCTNRPVSAYGYLEVQQYTAGSTFIQQRFTTLDTATPEVYIRNRSSGTWGAWRIVSLNENSRVLLQTLTAANSANLADTSVLATAGFAAYELIFTNLIPATNAVGLQLQVYSGGSYQTSGYTGYVTAIQASFNIQNETTWVPLVRTTNAGLSNVALNGGYSGRMTVFNPAGIVSGKHWSGQGVSIDTITSTPGIQLVSSYWNNAAAITGFRVQASSGNLTSGNIKIYGLR